MEKASSFSIVFFCGTVDGRNPAPPRMMMIPLFIGFKHFFHQQYHPVA